MSSIELVGRGLGSTKFAILIGETTDLDYEQHRTLVKILTKRIENAEEIRRNHVIIRDTE